MKTISTQRRKGAEFKNYVRRSFALELLIAGKFVDRKKIAEALRIARKLSVNGTE